MIVDPDAMMVAFLREYGLPGARERAHYHVGRCVEAGLVDDAAFWIRISNQLENLASSDCGPATLAIVPDRGSCAATQSG